MPTFKDVVEDFSATLDALRDFVACVGPVLTQRQEQMATTASKTVGRFQVASLLADEDLDTSDLEPEQKKILMKMRDILTGVDPDASPEKISAFRNKVTEIIPIRIVGNRIELDADSPSAPELIAHQKAIEKLRKEIGLLRESALMALTSRSEWFVAQLMHVYFHMHPEAAGMSEPFFSLDALASLQTIDDARGVLIDHKIESIMRLSFEDWLNFFKEKPKLGLSYLDADRNRLAEIFKRRNLIVHNGGRVSRKYLKEVEESLHAGMKVGDSIEISPDYLSTSIDLMEHHFTLIAAELWKKLEPKDQNRGSLLVNLAVPSLEARRWMAARGFSYFVLNDKNQVESTRLAAQINYWQSYKWAGQFEEVRLELENSDFSAKMPIYRLAHAALTDDFESFFKLLPGVLESGELLKNHLSSWPLFQGIRQHPSYAGYCPPESQKVDDGKSHSETIAEASASTSSSDPVN